MIRPATEADIPALVEMGARFHAVAGFKEFAFKPDDFAGSLLSLMGADCFICLIADDHSGAVAGITAPVYFNHSHISGEELFWWSEKAGTGSELIAALEAAAQAKGCSSWQMKEIHHLSGERLGNFYERRGYRRLEHSYIKGF